MNKVYKAVLSAAAIAIVGGAMIAPASVLAWGDSDNGRPSYTLDEINAGKLGNKITFNSISNGSKIGNEKNFVSAKSSSSKAEWGFNELEVKDGETYTILLYVHNNNPNGEKAVAENTNVTFQLPTDVAKSQTIVGKINSSNASPTTYWDEVVLKSNEDFYVEYVAGSATYSNDKLGTVSLSDDIKSTSVKVGYDKLDGKIPGCYKYSGTVAIKVKVHKSVSYELQKYVRLKGTTDWSESVKAKVGDEVEFKIFFKNLRDKRVNDVMILDTLPKNMEYVKGTTSLHNKSNPNGFTTKDTITTTGINIGDYDPNGSASVLFTAKVVDKALACGDNHLSNWATAAVDGKKDVVVKDDASVTVKKTGGKCDKPDPDPDPKPTPPEPDPEPTPTPGPLPDTGAGSIIVSALGAGTIVTAGGYYIASRKKLMKK